MEQLYPIDLERLKAIIARYPNAKRLTWVQEEPENNGAWRFMQTMFKKHLELDLTYIGRDESSSPAVGSLTISNLEQKTILDVAIGSEAPEEDPTDHAPDEAPPTEDTTSTEPSEDVEKTKDILVESGTDEKSEETTEQDSGQIEMEQRSDARLRGKNPPKTRRKKKAS